MKIFKLSPARESSDGRQNYICTHYRPAPGMRQP